MGIVIGGIYEISKKWHPYDENIINHRPCIVIKEEGNYAYIILMDVVHSNSDRNKTIFIEYYINDNKYISAISCDVVHRIKKKLLINNLGYISSDVVDAIIQCNGNITPRERYIKLYNKEENDRNKNKLDIINDNKGHNITISNEAKLIEVLSNIQQNTSVTRRITETNNKKINIWKERVINIFIGIITSLLTTIIYENRFILMYALYGRIYKILKYIINLFQ